MKYKIFWCKVNKYYSDEWLNSEYLKDKSGVFVASCVVTDKAKKKWLKFVKQELVNLKENEKIYISGCWAFEKGEENKKFFEIYEELKDYKNKLEILPESPNKNLSPMPDTQENKKETKFKFPKINLTTKKFLVIQWWCDSFCTFCLTVIKRWKHFYRSREDIVQEIIDFEIQGWKEIVLTWVNLWAWGKENTNDYKDSKLSEILEYILEKTKIPRIRISSLWPEFVDEKVLKVFENKRILPHFHFSIQSWSSSILKSMRRHYDWDYMMNLLDKTRKIKREDWVSISIWADLIVWFPGETEEDFMQTCNLVKNYNITKLHVFPFSNHVLWEHVPASFFDNQVSEKIKKDRVNRLTDIWNEIRNNFIKWEKWKILNVLIESVKDWKFKWWSENYIECNQDNFEVIHWNIKKNEIIVWKLK
jgi:MiaB/RimO family radical SAM methylthiotransferase